MIKNVTIYCSSSNSLPSHYYNETKEIGKVLAQNEIELVYGGGNVGMMGILANAVVEHGGEVTGVITNHLFKMEVAFTELSDLRVVETMHERKALMAELSDGFIAMPGGFGTMDEMFEILTWAQLNIHEKPCGFLNVNGYYDKLVGFIDHMISQQFVKEDYKGLVLMDKDPEGLLNQFRNYTHIRVEKGKWAKKFAMASQKA